MKLYFYSTVCLLLVQTQEMFNCQCFIQSQQIYLNKTDILYRPISYSTSLKTSPTRFHSISLFDLFKLNVQIKLCKTSQYEFLIYRNSFMRYVTLICTSLPLYNAPYVLPCPPNLCSLRNTKMYYHLVYFYLNF